MQKVRVDPRDAAFEVDQPAYRVYFYDARGASEEWELVGARDVHEVLRFAASNPEGERFVIYAVVPATATEPVGLVRLAGAEATGEDPRSS